MRIYLKKLVQVFLAFSVGCILVLNFYKRDEWVTQGVDVYPWGVNYQRHEGKRKLDFTGPKVHHHVPGAMARPANITVINEGSIFYKAPRNKGLIYPDPDRIQDRILNQLEFIPVNVKERGEDEPMKTIVVYNGFSGWDVKPGQQTFIDQKCPVNRCFLSPDRQKGLDADAILFSHSPSRPVFKRPLNQIWILFMLESPYHTPGLSAYQDIFNWTATYRHDSTIVAPYEKFSPFNESVQTKPQTKNYAGGKTKQVAWFVSNCGARNGRRQYANELAKYIGVDIYGGCGTLKCPRYQAGKCFDMLNKDYKFYLAFENSNCRDYITEKFFVNGLQHDVIPIVMGASPDDYKRAAPVHSYIHVDDFESPKDLAEYLHKLDKNDDLYNEYFRWKGTGSFINTFFWCRVCALLHDNQRKTSWFNDVEKWWRGPDVCIGQETWREFDKRKHGNKK
ncbi:glycoprotein 3-alpha-L-fucosyltransferase A [Patella vulgata]|uniref:glycoprotein 3-alpha-L-fucosyltransferase A n=1 Tax=Patella vulgata TaxID=6465 RepID=UPI00217F8EF6|nr:glycoprotein 3-alpha-L-fucosyltransferase A [Patella vulgata]